MTMNRGIALLGAALVLQLASLGYYSWYFDAHGYWPAPFIYNRFDTFMDLYNSMWWAGDWGKYTVWKSVYPPLNFLILDVLRLSVYGPMTIDSSLALRDLSLTPAILLSALYLVAPFVIVMTGRWSVLSPLQRILIALGLALSPPLLFALERGNLIGLALLVIPMVFSRKTIWKVLGIAILINLKPYFAVLLLTFAIAGDWRTLIQATAASGALFVFTGLVNDPNFLWFIPNIFSFADTEQILSGREVMALPSTISAFSYVLRIALKNSTESGFPVALTEAAIPLIEAAKVAGLCALIASMMVARRRLRESEIAVGLLVIIINLGISVGGYSQIFYISCIPVFVGMQLQKLHLALLAAIFLPLDMIVLLTQNLGQIVAFPQINIVDSEFQITVGTVLRPLLNYALLFSLSFEFLARRSFAAAPGKVSFA